MDCSLTICSVDFSVNLSFHMDYRVINSLSLSLSLYNIYIYLYTLTSQELSTRVKELTAATSIMQSFSNELSTPVSNSRKCKQTKANLKCVIIPELM